MPVPKNAPEGRSDTAHRFLPVLLLLFVGSGCAALIYEVVWLQLLQLVVGSNAISVGVLLATFMGGMCLGSYLLPRYVDRKHHPLKVYAFLELGIGALGLILLFGMPLVNTLYIAVGGGPFVRAFFAAICLLPPTLLMGATLPAIARWVETTPKGVAWLGYFYGGNTAGAVLGCLLAGFYLLRVYDMSITTYVAVAINIAVAGLGLLLAKMTVYEPLPASSDAIQAAPGSRAVYLTIALSGFTALAAEAIWTRILGLLFGATTYTFSQVLAVFLIGLGIGSSIGSTMARDLKRPRLALGWCQMLLCAAMAWTAYTTTQQLPYWPIKPDLAPNIWFNLQLDFVRCMWAVLPAAILWGASFPLALASVANQGQDPARLVGGVYAANTVGAIAGAASSLAMVVWLQTQRSQMLLIVIAAVSALIMLAPIVAGEGDEKKAPKGSRGKMSLIGVAGLVLCTAGAGWLARTVPEIPGILIAYGRYAVTWIGQSSIIYTGEGMQAFVAVSQLPSGVRNYHNAGKVQASSEPQDMRLQRMLGHLTTMIPKSPKKVVVIGCGAGVTAGAVSIGVGLEEETIAEIEKLVPYSVDEYFGPYNFEVIKNKKVHVHLDDARHFLLTTKEKFDAVTSDPLDPWVKGAATLYTKEFFDVVKEHLNPGGVVTLFVQLYESNEAAVKSEVGTFFEAFPNAMVFGNTQNGQGYDLVLVGQAEPTKIDIDEMDARLRRPEYQQMAQSLREIGFNSATDLFATFAGQASDLKPWLADAQINHDWNLRLQFLAGMGLNLYQSGPIYSNMITNTRFPDNIFTGSPASLAALRDAMLRAQGR
jgi:spermidine synthase